jgi:hypothetical protein
MVKFSLGNFPCPSQDKIQPQFGLESIDATRITIDVLAKGAGITCSDDIIAEIEGLVALFVAVSKSKDMVGVTANLFLYIRSKFSTSVSSVLIKYVQEVLETTPQSGDEDIEPQWLSFLKEIRTNWSMCTGVGLFKQFSKILSIISIAGLAKVSDLKFTLGNFKLIEPDTQLLTATATDLTSAVFDLVIYFTERCYHAWKLKSFRPLFSNNL